MPSRRVGGWSPIGGAILFWVSRFLISLTALALFSEIGRGLAPVVRATTRPRSRLFSVALGWTGWGPVRADGA